MTTRILDHTIPSAFRRFDAHTTAAHEFANVRDLQVARENLNILMARRVRGMIAGQSFCDSTGAVNGDLEWVQVAGPDPVNSDPVIVVPIYLPRIVKTCTFVVRAAKATGGADPDIELWPCIAGSGAVPVIDDTKKITVNAVAEARYAVSFGVPQESSFFAPVFYLFASTPSHGADLKVGNANIVDVGWTWLTSDAGAGYDNKLMYCSDVTVEPRLVAGSQTVGANITHIPDRRFNKLPIPGVDTVNWRTIQILKLWSWALYGDAISDFSADEDVL